MRALNLSAMNFKEAWMLGIAGLGVFQEYALGMVMGVANNWSAVMTVAGFIVVTGGKLLEVWHKHQKHVQQMKFKQEEHEHKMKLSFIEEEHKRQQLQKQ